MYIVIDRGAKPPYNTVVAPTGHHRTRDGTIRPDGSSSPEMGERAHAHHFTTHRSAARVAAKLADPAIVEVPAPR